MDYMERQEEMSGQESDLDVDTVTAASDHLGRRAEDALFQRADTEPAEGVVPSGPISQPQQEKGTGSSHWTHSYTGRKLV